MFDQETTQFFHMLRANTIGEGASIGLRSVLESNIPSNVKTFFRADVEWLRAQEKLREIRSSKFTFGIPEVRLLEEQIDLLLVNNYTFSRKDFDATADKCIHFLFNYLCRPQWTLASFFFDATIRITAEEMLAKLRYCSDYSYYRAVLAKYAESRQRTDVGSEEMKRLLKTIDDEVCGQATPKELTAIARPMFEFTGAIRASMPTPLPARVPVRALIYFFEDKKLSHYAEALSAIREKDNALEFTQSMLEMVLDAVYQGNMIPEIETLAAAARAASVDVQPVHPAASFYSSGSRTAEDIEHDMGQLQFTYAESDPQHQDDAPLPETVGLSDHDEPDAGPPADESGRTALRPLDNDEDEIQRLMFQRQAEIVEPEDEPEGLQEEAPPMQQQTDEALPAETEEPTPEDMDAALSDTDENGLQIVSPPYVSESDRQTIISTLFHGDETKFDEAINTAANTRTWDEAIITLDRFFAEQGIDPFSKEAMMFANILETWHRSLSGGDDQQA